MAKRRYRIEGGRYGGELVMGEVNPGFASHYANGDNQELIDAVLEADQMGWSEQEEPDDALLDPNAPPGPATDEDEYFNMWENDEFEHINSAYADGGFTVYEVPADGSDDWNYDNEVYEGEGIVVYSREGGYISNEEPDAIYEEDEDGNKYLPVLLFHSCEKGQFAVWFLETEEDFDEFKLGYGVCETNLGEFIDRVYYDKNELEENYDYNDTTGKSYEADVGWLNIKWHDSFSRFNESDMDPVYWEDFDDNAEYERENR